MKIYLYDEQTNEYLYEAEAQIDPLASSKGEMIYLMPPNATQIAPLESKAGYANVFSDGKWEQIKDERGKTYYDSRTDSAITITKLQEELGYLKIINEEYPTNIGETKKVIETKKVKGDTYITSYRVVSKSLEELTELFKKKTQELLDTKAKEKGYDDILSACSYAGYENDFKAEGEAFGIWRAKVWKYGYALLDAIGKGERTLPKSFEELMKELPKFEEK